MADHQEAIGEKAFKCVDSLNRETVSQFNSISTFKDSISQKKALAKYYKENTTVKPFIINTFKNKPSTTVPGTRRSDLHENFGRSAVHITDRSGNRLDENIFNSFNSST